MLSSPTATVLCLPHWRDEATCEAILEHVARHPFEPGHVALPEEDRTGAEPTFRSCTLSRHLPAELLDAILSDVMALTRRAYPFDITGQSLLDPPTLMRYAPGDHFTWHMDNAIDAPPFATRKLSFTLQLSDPDDYDGGDLEIAPWAGSFGAHEDPARRALARGRGTLIVFPSLLTHRVSPVLRGVRQALVGWLHGPHFR